MGKKGKAKSGTWFTREMANSKAYWALSSTAKGMLIQFLLKRDMSKQHECINERSIVLTYKELENVHGKDMFGNSTGIARTSISRGIKDLMAKGFIDIVRQGGAYQKDKTVYALIDDWKWWSHGVVVKQKMQGKRAGAFALQKSQPPN